MKALREQMPDCELYFLFGADSLLQLETWYKAEELKNLVHFIVFPRRGDVLENKETWDYELANMEYVDISSTEIREGNIENTSVKGYIEKNGLYKI